MNDLKSYFSQQDKIKQLESEVELWKKKYNTIISKGLSVRAEKALRLLKQGNMTHREISEKVFLSLYHIRRLSSELKKGLRD